MCNIGLSRLCGTIALASLLVPKLASTSSRKSSVQGATKQRFSFRQIFTASFAAQINSAKNHWKGVSKKQNSSSRSGALYIVSAIPQLELGKHLNLSSGRAHFLLRYFQSGTLLTENIAVYQVFHATDPESQSRVKLS